MVNQLILDVIGALATAIGAYLAPTVKHFLKTNSLAKKLLSNKTLIEMAQEAVHYAEDAGKLYAGSEQFKIAKTHFIGMLQSRNIDITGAELDSKIQYAYNLVKKEFTTEFEAEIADESGEPTEPAQSEVADETSALTAANEPTTNAAPATNDAAVTGKPTVSVPDGKAYLMDTVLANGMKTGDFVKLVAAELKK